MTNNLPVDYEIQPYRRFECNDGQKFYSLSAKTRKKNSTVIEYTERKCWPNKTLHLVL